MSAVEDELAELLGSAEDVPQFIAFAREQVKTGRALWGNPPMPEAERLKVLADLLRSGKAGQSTLDAVADLLDPDVENGDQKLVFGHRRAGNPKSADGGATGIERVMIRLQASRLYQKMIQEGHSARGLKKRVSDAIGKRYGKEGSTIDKLWSVADARRPGRRPSPNSAAPKPASST